MPTTHRPTAEAKRLRRRARLLMDRGGLVIERASVADLPAATARAFRMADRAGRARRLARQLSA